MPQGAPPVAPPAAPPRVSTPSVNGTAKPAFYSNGAARPAQPQPSAPAQPAGPSREEERAHEERIEAEKRLKEEFEEEEKERLEHAKKEAEEEVRKIKERLSQIDSEIRAAYKAIALAIAEALVNPEAAAEIVPLKNRISALKNEKKSLRPRLKYAKELVKKFGGAIGAVGGAFAKLGGAAVGPTVMFVVGIFLWLLLRMYGFGKLANWVMFSVIAALLISLIFKEPRKSFIVFLLPILIWLLDRLNMSTPTNNSIAVSFVLAIMLLTFDVARTSISRLLEVGAYLGGGVLIFWMSAWAQMELGNAYPHIITTVVMFGYFMWVLTRKGGLKWAAVVINVLFFTSLFVVPSIYAPPGSPFRDATDSQIDAWYSMFGLLGRAGQEVVKGVKSNYLMGIGEYEEGVEAESKKPLGVFLENVGVTSKFVSPEGQIDVFARLRATSFKTDEQLNVSVTCYEESVPLELGTIRPRSKFVVEEYESQDIDCIISAASKMGPQRIVLDTSFTFVTNSFLKVYFMEQDRIRAYKRQHSEDNSNPLDQFEITDKNPVAIFTGGPLKVGMGVAQQPIPLTTPNSADDSFGPTLGITLDRNWIEGELLEVSKIVITAPPGLVIKDVDGVAVKCSPNSMKEHECVLEGEILKKFFVQKPVTLPKTLRVHTDIDPQGIAIVLGGAPMSIRSFKSEIFYTYRIKKEASVTVKQEVKK